MKNNNTLKANVLIAAVLGCIGFSGAVNAAPSSKQLNLQWTGTIPAAPSAGGDWNFVDLMDTTKAYVPQSGILTISDDAAAVGGKLIQMSPMSFGIKANSGTLKVASKVTAYLSNKVVFTGLTPTTANALEPSATVQIGGQPLTVGAATPTEVATIGATQDVAAVSVTASGKLPVGSFAEGNVVGTQASIMFSADVTP